MKRFIGIIVCISSFNQLIGLPDQDKTLYIHGKKYKYVSNDLQKKLNSISKKTYLQPMQLAYKECKLTKSLYVGMHPSYGPFSGHYLEMVFLDNKVFGRIRTANKGSFSKWFYINIFPFSIKKHKEMGSHICHDGSITTQKKK